MLLTISVYAQDTLDTGDDDINIDLNSTSSSFYLNKHVENHRKYLLGIGYGLNPIIILAPALSVGIYSDPIVIGFEISDSDNLGIWEKERRENLGTSRFSGDTQFLKWFLFENFYLMGAREQRSAEIWGITFNREGEGEAVFDMLLKTTVVSLGIGLLRLNEIGFLSIDIIRLSFFQNQFVEVKEHWESWSELSGTRERLNQNIRDRSEKWLGWLNSSTGFIVTFGVNF